MGQLLLIPDLRPLDRRLGRQFFSKVPRRPGVYLMKDGQGRIVYVGKAKDLKQRLGHYRIANPDRLRRRHLRMLHEVARIDFQFCPTEAAALKQEKKLIRSHKPKFNRAGVWTGNPKFIVWRVTGDVLEISVRETPPTGWHRFGPLGGGATYVQSSLARMLWLAMNGEKTLGQMPAGWMRGECMETAAIRGGASIGELREALESFFWRDAESFLLWLGAKLSHRTHRFERQVIQAEVENLHEFGTKQKSDGEKRSQFFLL